MKVVVNNKTISVIFQIPGYEGDAEATFCCRLHPARLQSLLFGGKCSSTECLEAQKKMFKAALRGEPPTAEDMMATLEGTTAIPNGFPLNMDKFEAATKVAIEEDTSWQQEIIAHLQQWASVVKNPPHPADVDPAAWAEAYNIYRIGKD